MTKRAFVAIEIPEKIKKKIIEIQDKLPFFEGKKIPVENLHLTLKFLGWVKDEQIEEIKKILGKIKYHKFEIEINSIGMFADRIIWLNMFNCDELQKQVDDQLSNLFKKEERFMGHLTIGRIKHIENKKEFVDKLKKIKIKPIKFKIEEFKLKKSTLRRSGPIYEDIEKYNLE